MAKYLVKYYADDTMVDTTETDDLSEACEFVLAMDCDAFACDGDIDWDEEDEEEYYEPSYYAEVKETDSLTTLFWANTEGDRGSDCPEGHPEEETIDYYLRF